MAIKHSFNYHPIFQGSRICPHLYFYRALPNSSGKFLNVWGSDYWKMYFWVKKLKEKILCPARQNSPTGSYHYLPSKGKLPIPIRQYFFGKSVFPMRKGWGGGNCIVDGVIGCLVGEKSSVKNHRGKILCSLIDDQLQV